MQSLTSLKVCRLRQKLHSLKCGIIKYYDHLVSFAHVQELIYVLHSTICFLSTTFLKLIQLVFENNYLENYLPSNLTFKMFPYAITSLPIPALNCMFFSSI